MHFKDVVKSFFGFIGIILIIKPPFIFEILEEKLDENIIDDSGRIFGSSLVLIAAVCAAFIMVTMKSLRN
jgi:drug/metabolite transporter (DMT)-like permease